MVFQKISESHKKVGGNGECLYIAFTKLSMFFLFLIAFERNTLIDMEKESLEAIFRFNIL